MAAPRSSSNRQASRALANTKAICQIVDLRDHLLGSTGWRLRNFLFPQTILLPRGSFQSVEGDAPPQRAVRLGRHPNLGPHSRDRLETPARLLGSLCL